MAEETDVLTDHEYDGIQEFDNPLPRWWLTTFVLTIVFSLFYWLVWHTLPNHEGTFGLHAAEMAEYEKLLLAQSISEDELLALVDDDAAVAEGRELFATHCASCHGPQGEGGIGPNLTDAYWIHGQAPKDIWVTINAGVTAQGMPAWRSQLGSRTNEVTAYLLSIQDTNVQGKAPEGVDADGDAP